MSSTREPSPTNTYSTAATLSEVTSDLLSDVGTNLVGEASDRSVTPKPKPEDQLKRTVGKYEVDVKEAQRKVEEAQKELAAKLEAIQSGAMVEEQLEFDRKAEKLRDDAQAMLDELIQLTEVVEKMMIDRRH